MAKMSDKQLAKNKRGYLNAIVVAVLLLALLPITVFLQFYSKAAFQREKRASDGNYAESGGSD